MFAGRSAPRAIKRRLLVASLAFFTAGAAFVAPSFAAESTTSKTPVVIGLGDSFTSGVGASVLDEKSGICRRSTMSYPLVAARELKVIGANAACSGAPASALTQTFRGQLPQLDKAKGAKFIVMTMGGNDVLSLDNAKNFLVDKDALTTNLATLDTQLTANLKVAVETKAKVVIMGYPRMFPTDETACSAALRTISPLANDAVDLLNETVRGSATTAGATFVDTSPAFVGHDLCSTDPYLTDLSDFDVALHPNDKGHAALAKVAVDTIKPLLPSTNDVAIPSVTKAPKAEPISDMPTKSEPKTLGHQDGNTHKAGEGHDDGDKMDMPKLETPKAETKVVTKTETATPKMTLPDTDSATTTAPPQLAMTGSTTPLHLAFGSLLMAIGLGLMWLRMRVEEAYA